MSSVAAIVYVAHTQSFLRTLEATDAHIYLLTKEGALRSHRGPARKLIAKIPATQVVWVGVPPKWARKLGTLPFKSHFVGTPLRWQRMTNTTSAVSAIKAATTQSKTEEYKEKVQAARETATIFHKAQVAMLHSAAPWHVPEALR